MIARILQRDRNLLRVALFDYRVIFMRARNRWAHRAMYTYMLEPGRLYGWHIIQITRFTQLAFRGASRKRGAA